MLGAGRSIAQVCTEASWSKEQFQDWWQQEARTRVPKMEGSRRLAVNHPVTIDRDSLGIPHISAESDEDLFFGFGYAMAQDRLFQLDYLRRRGSGRMAEIFGPDGTELDFVGRIAGFRSVLELDLVARTVGLRRIAEIEWTKLSTKTQALVTAFSNGINAVIEESRQNLPIEFDLLDYQPEPWSPIDCLTIEGEFRWYLTGRFPVIVLPELAKRALGDGPLYRAFLQVERDDESILPPGSYAKSRCGAQPIGQAANDPDAGQGSNNWVVAGKRTATGKPLLASDPHIAFDAFSCWYEVHLQGGSFHVAGVSYVGMPGVLFGRNERVAWGCTNNICSQRDLYQEKTDPAHPDCFLFDGKWEPARKREEIIKVKGGQPVQKTIRFSRNGPIVDEVLPPLARNTGPVSLKWLGAYEGGWLTALLGMDRAKSADEFRTALKPWHVPTFSVVFADVDGHIGYHSTGRVPIRNAWERGYRPGWDPEHQWQGLIPFEGMPQWSDPERGWIATANNRPAPEDFPYPLSGTWSDGLRATRIREMLDGKTGFAYKDFARMQQDALSLRAARCVPALLTALADNSDKRIVEAIEHLRKWDCRMEPDRIGGSIFDVFFSYWARAVAAERFDKDTAALLCGGVNGLSASLLSDDTVGWFGKGRRDAALINALTSAIQYLTDRLGPDMSQWQWGKIHILTLKHIMSGRGDLGQLLDHGGVPVPGDAQTVCNTGLGAQYESRMGATYRLVADLSTSPPELMAVDSQSQSGHPGSPHYRDQLPTWLKGEHHRFVLDGKGKSASGGTRLVLEPK